MTDINNEFNTLSAHVDQLEQRIDELESVLGSYLLPGTKPGEPNEGEPTHFSERRHHLLDLQRRVNRMSINITDFIIRFDDNQNKPKWCKEAE